MRVVEVIPGLIVDEEIFGAAVDCLTAHAPAHCAVTWESFTDPARWWLVPSPDDDDTGVPLAYKAEYVVIQSADLTIKINIWYRPDLRAGEISRPHTHPWVVMEAHPALGGYEDEHWYRSATGLLVYRGSVLNVPGSVNRIADLDYHQVRDVEAGRTVSVIICGRWLHDEANRGIWGHLDLDTGCHVPVQRDPVEQERFRSRVYRINPQHARLRRVRQVTS